MSRQSHPSASGFERTWSDRLLAFSLGLVPAERHRLFAVTILVGGVCGVLAVLFHSTIRSFESLLIGPALDATGISFVVATITIPTLGALVSGALLHFFFPNARGSGIPQVKLVYAAKSGRIRVRDAFGKFFLSALQIGSGSSLGREGPTVQICAGAATALGRLFAISPRNRLRLLPVGAAAGVAAAFNAPIAAVTFITEEIIGDLDNTLLSGVVVAAALAAVIERSLLGEHPVFNVPREYGLEHASSLLSYAALGCVAAGIAHLFYAMLLGLRGYCRSHGGRWAWAWPAVGGLVTGCLAVLCIHFIGLRGVTGDGYVTLSAALHGNVAWQAMLALIVAKLLATVTCYSTGGAGGIFAPVLFIGAMLGGSFGYLDRLVLQHADAQLGGFALVGMGALFAAVIRAPITSVLIIFEMTGSYRLVLPLMIANSAAYVLARRLWPTPIYEALLEQDGVHLPHESDPAMRLSAFRVRDAMTTELMSLPADLPLSAAGERIESLPFSLYPVLDSTGKFIGIVSDASIRRRLAGESATQSLRELARRRESLSPDLPLLEAVVRMHRLGVRQMAVTAQDDPQQLLGMLAMSDIMRAHVSASEADGGKPAERRSAVRWHDSGLDQEK